VKKLAAWGLCGVAAIVIATSGCGGPAAEFTLSNALVDSNHPCPSGASNAAYTVHANLTGHNSRSSPVSISTVSAVLTLAAVHGGWLQTVGSKYEAADVAFTPDRVGAGSSATLNLAIPSACTNLAKSTGSLSYADYAVKFRVATSAGTFTVESTNRHRIIVF
jgi:hypothetical protein